MGSATYDCPNCGSSIRVSRGNNANSASYARWCERQGMVCDECSRKAFKAAHAAAVAAAAADPRTASLPVLTGTEKQVAWAKALRLEALAAIEASVAELVAELGAEDRISDAARLETTDGIHLIAQEWRDRTDAKAWIDGRGRYDKETIWTELRRRLHTLCPTAHAEMLAERAKRSAK